MIYTVTAFLLFFLSVYAWDSPRKGKSFFAIAMIWLVIFEGFRWEIGTDWFSYYYFFVDGENEHMGPTYTWLNDFFKLFTSSYTFLLLFISIVTYGTLSILFRNYSASVLMSLLIYFCSFIGMMGSNRQILAMVVCVISLKFVLERRLIWFLIMIVLATSLHITAIIFLPAYFLYDRVLSKKVLIGAVLVAFLIGLSKVINRIPYAEYLAMLDSMTSDTTNLDSYVDSYGGGVSLFGSLKRILFVYLAVMVREKVKNPYYSFFLSLYVMGSIIYMIFNGSVLQIMAGRGASYYTLYETIVIPYVILNLKIPVKQRKLVWFGLFLIYFYLMWRDMNSYFILDGVDIYNPYKSILF